MPGSYIVARARTPIGKLSGALADFIAADLGGFAIARVLRRAGVQAQEMRKSGLARYPTAAKGWRTSPTSSKTILFPPIARTVCDFRYLCPERSRLRV